MELVEKKPIMAYVVQYGIVLFGTMLAVISACDQIELEPKFRIINKLNFSLSIIPLIIGFMGWVVCEYLFAFEGKLSRRLNEGVDSIENLRKDIMGHVDTEVNNIMKYMVANGYKSGLSSALSIFQSQRYTDDFKWAIARFLSRSLSECVDDKEIIIPNLAAKDYSELLSKLYMECREQIVSFCPLKPRDWLDLMLKKANSNETEGYFKFAYLLSQAPHLRAFLPSVAKKNRYLIVAKNEFNAVCEDVESLRKFTHFAVNGGSPINLEEVFFTKHHIIGVERENNILGEYLGEDVNILDSDIIITWKPNIEIRDNDDVGVCTLILDREKLQKIQGELNRLKGDSNYRAVKNILSH